MKFRISSVRSVISEAIRRWGIKIVLREVVDILKRSDDDKLRSLGKDIEKCLERYSG
jgi:hypothetical protein